MTDYHKLCIEQGKQIAMLEAELARVRDDNREQLRRLVKLEGDVMNDKLHLDHVVHDYTKKIAVLESELARVKSAIHYPECWDTVGYPTLYDAVNEIGCSPEDCTHKKGEGKG